MRTRGHHASALHCELTSFSHSRVKGSYYYPVDTRPPHPCPTQRRSPGPLGGCEARGVWLASALPCFLSLPLSFPLLPTLFNMPSLSSDTLASPPKVFIHLYFLSPYFPFPGKLLKERVNCLLTSFTQRWAISPSDQHPYIQNKIALC